MIREEQKNLWSPDFDDYWRCILVNGDVNRNGQAVMGAGCALEAAGRYPWLSNRFGHNLQKFELGIFLVTGEKLIMFPTKYHFKEPASYTLIRNSCIQLRELLLPTTIKVVLPRPGVGLGQLQWSKVKTIVDSSLGDLSNEIVVVYL